MKGSGGMGLTGHERTSTPAEGTLTQFDSNAWLCTYLEA